jgi:hypothetical protein
MVCKGTQGHTRAHKGTQGHTRAHKGGVEGGMVAWWHGGMVAWWQVISYLEEGEQKEHDIIP